MDYEILPGALAHFIKETLLSPLTGLFEDFPWDLSKMAVRETASWQDITKVDMSVPYFQGRFLKAKSGRATKTDSTLMFSPPKNPIEFSLIVDHDQWIQAEEFIEDKKSKANNHPLELRRPAVC